MTTWLNMTFFKWFLITDLKVVFNYFLLKIRMMGDATLSVENLAQKLIIQVVNSGTNILAGCLSGAILIRAY